MSEITTARDRYTPAALQLADQLCDAPDVHRAVAAARLPEWLRSVLCDAVLWPAELDWPNFTRTPSSIDWPRLIGEHPDVLAPARDMLALNNGPSWEALVAAFAELQTAGAAPRLDVFLWVAVDGRIHVDPVALIAEPQQVSIELQVLVDAILIAGGRTGLLRTDVDSHATWMVGF